MQVPSINHSFKFSAEKAEQLWLEGMPLFDDPETNFVTSPLAESMPYDSKLRRSTDGEWVVRRCVNLGNQLSHEAIVSNGLLELQRLQAAGVNVISHSIALLETSRVYSVTPWIPKMKVCCTNAFEEHIEPCLSQYYAESPGGVVLRRVEIEKPWQYSTGDTPELALPFLHDTDPLLDLVH